MIEKLAKGQQTRERIISEAAQLIHMQGYHNTGLQQILDASGSTKGGFYFHFKDKKSLVLAIIEHFQGFFVGTLAADLSNDSLSPMAKIEGFHHRVCHVFGGEANMAGCPIGNLTLELAGLDPDIQKKLDWAFSRMVRGFSHIISQGQEDGSFTRSQSADELADFFVTSWEGAVLRMKASRSLAPLDSWFSTIKRMLLGTVYRTEDAL